METKIDYDFEFVVYELYCVHNSSGLLHTSTSFCERRSRRRDQYLVIDELNKNDNVIDAVENDEDTGGQSKAVTGGNHGWNSLRAVVAYYCSLRKIKRQIN